MRLIAHPRPHNTNIEIKAFTVKSQTANYLVNDDANTITQQTDEQFLEGKFVCYAPTHHSAVVVGSTTQDNNQNATREILDASKVVYRNDFSIRTDVEMALANGDEISSDIAGNHYFIQQTCDNLIGEAIINQILPDDTNVMANKALGTVSNYGNDKRAKSTLTAAKLNSKNKDNITVSCINIGNNVFLVLDGTTGLVKHILNPRYELVNGKRLPIHLQSLIHKSNPFLYIDREQFHVKSNDIVILGSAGFVDTLAGTEKTYSIATDQIINAAGESVGKQGQRSLVSFTQKEIDIDKLNARLQIIFANLHHQYPLQPPAFAIAEALIKDTAHLSLTDRQKKQKFAQGIRIKIREYKKMSCSAEEDQHNESSKQVRDECARQCLTYNYGKLKSVLMDFREIMFKTKNSAIVPVTNIIWANFLQDIAQKLLQGQVTSGKGKEYAVANNQPELTPEQIFKIITDTIKSILQKNIDTPESVNEMMELVVIIFGNEIQDFVGKLSGKLITAEVIARYGKIFHDSLIDKSFEFKLTTESLDNFLSNFKNLWSEDLSSWSEVYNTSETHLSSRLIKLLTRYLSVDEENVKKDFWWILRFVHYLDLEQKKKINELPYLQTTIGQFIERISGVVRHEEIQEINQYLIEHSIDKNTPLHQIEPHFSLENQKYGDDTTVSVAYMLDPALEIVRAITYYCRFDDYSDQYNIETYFKTKREEYWKMLCNLYPDKKPTTEALNLLVAKLRAEQQIGQLEPGPYYNACIGSKKLEDLNSHILYSYTEEEILSLEQFFSLKTKLQLEVTGINNVTAAVAEKSSAHFKLNTILLKPELNALEICGLYNELTKTQFDKLNKHRYGFIDSLLGIAITRTWSATLKVLRDYCLTKLMTEVNQLLDNNGAAPNRDQYIKALALLNVAVTKPLFNTHRNNSIFTGAYGDTSAVKTIRQRIVIVTDQLSALQNSKTEGIELKPR